jgi:pimeloyl-ACP methyl ester carboxylesterase
LVSENQRGWRELFDYIKAFSETDFTEDLKKIDVPTLILHGDDDQIFPRETKPPHFRDQRRPRVDSPKGR